VNDWFDPGVLYTDDIAKLNQAVDATLLRAQVEDVFVHIFYIS